MAACAERTVLRCAGQCPDGSMMGQAGSVCGAPTYRHQQQHCAGGVPASGGASGTVGAAGHDGRSITRTPLRLEQLRGGIGDVLAKRPPRNRLNIERSFRDVLTAVAGPENLVSEFDNDLVSRLRRFVEDVFTEKRREQWRHFRIVLALLTIALPLLGGGLGIVFANTSLKDLSPPGKTAVWLGYAILSCFVLAVAKWLPDDVARIEQEIKRIRL